MDVTLGNQNFDREFKITVTHNNDDKSLLDHVKGLGISPENYLLAAEEQLKPFTKNIMWEQNFYVLKICMAFLQ